MVFFRGVFRELRLRVWPQQVFRLSAIDGVAKLPAAKRPTTLRPVSTQTEVTLSTWCNCTHEDAVSNFISGSAFSKLVDDAHGLMADDQARFDGIFTPQNVEVRTANGRECYTYYRFARSRPRDGHCLQADLTRSVK